MKKNHTEAKAAAAEEEEGEGDVKAASPTLPEDNFSKLCIFNAR